MKSRWWAASLAVIVTACAHAPLLGSTTQALPFDESHADVMSAGRTLSVDVYAPTGRGRHPAAILLHGSGGIHTPIGSVVTRYAEALAAQGVAAFVVHYFDGTGTFASDDSIETANYFVWVRDVRAAITWAAARPDVRANSIGIVGHSLGAFLAVGVAAADSRVNGIVLFGAALEPFVRDSIRRMPPSLMYHGEDDDVVPREQADTLAAFLRARRFAVEYHVIAGEAHEFSDSAATVALERAARFLSSPRVRAPGGGASR